MTGVYTPTLQTEDGQTDSGWLTCRASHGKNTS